MSRPYSPIFAASWMIGQGVSSRSSHSAAAGRMTSAANVVRPVADLLLVVVQLEREGAPARLGPLGAEFAGQRHHVGGHRHGFGRSSASSQARCAQMLPTSVTVVCTNGYHCG